MNRTFLGTSLGSNKRGGTHMKRILSLTLALCLAVVLFAVPAGAETT